MAKIALKYDDRDLVVDLPSTNLSFYCQKAIFRPKCSRYCERAFRSPILSEKDPGIDDYRGKSIAIAINDQTRPLPHAVLIPSLLEYLIPNGADKGKITFYIATGTHRKLTTEEIRTVLPGNCRSNTRIFATTAMIRTIWSIWDPTSRQTPVFVNRRYYRSDVKIVIGNIEPHHFMGFQGE
jgi:nickel-dependent lactate racemase